MALIDAFKFAAQVANGEHGKSGPSPQQTIASPWSAGSLAKIAYSDIFGGQANVVTRAEAMKVPAIAKGRALICGTLSRQPLAKFVRAELVESDPWMYRSSAPVPPSTRMLWTLDDLIFYGSSLWAVERGTRGQVIDAARVPHEWWEIDDDLKLLVNGNEVDAEDVVLIEGPQDGLLDIAADDIKAARSMTRSWASRVKAPVPLVELHNTDPNADLMEEEVSDLVDAWEDARATGGATAYTPHNVEARVHGQATAELYVEGRNASRLDFANFLALPAALLEGSMSTASLTYSTQEGQRNELVDLSLSYWATPIEARLSMDDVTPRGTRIAFDLTYLSTPEQPAQGPVVED